MHITKYCKIEKNALFENVEKIIGWHKSRPYYAISINVLSVLRQYAYDELYFQYRHITDKQRLLGTISLNLHIHKFIYAVLRIFTGVCSTFYFFGVMAKIHFTSCTNNQIQKIFLEPKVVFEDEKMLTDGSWAPCQKSLSNSHTTATKTDLCLALVCCSFQVEILLSSPSHPAEVFYHPAPQ